MDVEEVALDIRREVLGRAVSHFGHTNLHMVFDPVAQTHKVVERYPTVRHGLRTGPKPVS